MGRSINSNYIIKDTILQSTDNKRIIKKIKKYKIILLHELILFITFIVKHKKLMQFMVPNKLFRVAEFTWKLGYSVCKRIKCPFGLAYFRAYIKQLMQINKFLCIIYKFLS